MNYENLSILKLHTNEELLSILFQSELLDAEMLSAVENELAFRNYLLDDISTLKKSLIEAEADELFEGKEATFPQQFLGWIGIFGVLGLIIGYELAFAKIKSKYSPKEYFKYDEPSRESGRYMFYISLALVVGFVLYKLANYLERL